MISLDEEIPNIYYQYLQDRDEASMLRYWTIIQDIFSNGSSTYKVIQINQNPAQIDLNSYEWLSLAKSWENQGDDERAIFAI